MADETRDIAITANQLAQNANVHGAINGVLVENLFHVLGSGPINEPTLS